MEREGGWLSHTSLFLVGWMGLALVANAWIPPFILETWVRDADVGLWFCAGLYLTELALPSWIAISMVGTLPQRWLLGAAMAWLFIVAAWLGFRFTGPVSHKDAICFLAVSFGSSLLFLVTNHGLSFLLGARLVMSPPWVRQAASTGDSEATAIETTIAKPEPTELLSNRGVAAWALPSQPGGLANEPGGLRVGANEPGHALSFGLMSLFVWIILAAATVSFCKQALGANDIAFRAIRITLVIESAYYTLARVLYVLCFQAVLLRWCLAPEGVGRWGWWWVLGFAMGLEGLRRFVSGLHGERSYLEWDFAPLVLGLIVGHVCLALMLRWRGLILQRS